MIDSQRLCDPHLLTRLRPKMVDRYLAERRAAALYLNGHLGNDRDLTTGPERVFFAVVAIIRGEARFLFEWLEFHLMMGVEHFIIYDNGLEKETAQMLAPYEASRQVTRIPWPNVGGTALHYTDRFRYRDRVRMQTLAYGDCVRRYAGQINWLLKLDLDEFIFPVSELQDSVAQVLRHLQRATLLGVRVPLLQFGSSGHDASPEGLVIENYVQCQREISRETKQIGNTDMIVRDSCIGPHAYPFRAVRKLQGLITGSPRVMGRRTTSGILRINHYRVKSRQDYLRKAKINAPGFMGGKETLERFKAIESTHNESVNRDIQRFVQPLRNRIGTAPPHT